MKEENCTGFCQLMSVFSVKVHGKVSLLIQCYKHTDKTTTPDQSIQQYRQAEGLLVGRVEVEGNKCQPQLQLTVPS